MAHNWEWAASQDAAWFKRRLENAPAASIGLGLSGGGIRSATFNLGILSVLREKGILKHVHYLSTVSGGGYIGAWLVGNALRNPGFLDDGADWSKPVSHLKRYSNYLSPELGFFSADTWTMAMIWLRNTILIQLELLSALLLPLLLVRFLPQLLLWIAACQAGVLSMEAVFLLLFFAAGLSMAKGLRSADERGARFSQARVLLMIVLPLLPASFALLPILWKFAPQAGGSFGAGLTFVWCQRWTAAPAIAVVWGIFLLIASAGLRKTDRLPRRIAFALFSGTAAAAVAILGMMRLLTWMPNAGPAQGGEGWGPYVAAAFILPAILFVFSLAAVLHIGISGRAMNDSAREWWSRLGAWLGICGLGLMALEAAVFFSGALIAWLQAWQGWSALGAWALSTLGALFAARNSRTGGPGERGSAALEALAAAGPYLFILGLIILVSAGVQYALAVLAGAELKWIYPGLIPPGAAAKLLGACLVVAALLAWRVDPNEFSLSNFYKNRLVRCFLGATRTDRSENRFTGFDFNDDIGFQDLAQHRYRGPLPILNTNLNLGGSSDLALHSRRSANFVFTPLYAGCGQMDHEGFRASGDFYRPERGLTLGTAMAISGAAASPNMGCHSSPAASVLLTLFNVRLGWWVPNTRERPETGLPLLGPVTLLRELSGQPGDSGAYINLSDGGHFENLALYELVRRKCKLIFVGDGEQDGGLTFGSLGKAIRMCESDFGARIRLDVSAIRKRNERSFSDSHCAVGSVEYADRSYGTIVYLKSSMTGDEPAELHQYKADHPAFPHQSTADQFFSEDQFESYRRLGEHIAATALAHLPAAGFDQPGALEEFCVQMKKRWFPTRADSAAFARNAATLNSLWRTLREDSDLQFLDEQFFPGWKSAAPSLPSPGEAANRQPRDPLDLPADPAAFRKGFYFCTELIQLMENVYLDSDLESNESSPDLRGWMNLFRHWTWSYMFRVTWALTSPTYGARFQIFCERVFRLRPFAPKAGGDRGSAAIALRLIEGPEAAKMLNPVERRIVELIENTAPGRLRLYVQALEPAPPIERVPTRSIPTGLALCDGDALVYLRIQDHLRQTGLGGALLDMLVERGVNSIQPVEVGVDALREWTPDEVRSWVARRHPKLQFHANGPDGDAQ